MRARRMPFGRQRGLQWRYRQMAEMESADGADATQDINVGGSLRRLREEQALTIRALAE